MDKIYSRKRICFPKRKRKKINKLYGFLFFAIGILLIAIISFAVASYPIFVASCKTAASSKAIHIVNSEVENVMNGYTYNDLMDIEKDENGNVTLLKANTVLVNQMTAKIASNIQKRIDQSPTTMVYINYGSVSGITILKNLGPKFDIELETAGRINRKIKSEFKSVGVNQTLHKIYIELDASIGILTPIGSYGQDISTEVLLTEAVIVGNVPETYYNLEGLNNSDALEVME